MEERKYELVKNDWINYYGYKLYRIKALKSIGEYYDGTRVLMSFANKGEFGGYVESEENLSQEDKSWIRNEGKVYNNAKVMGDSIISDWADVHGDAIIRNNSIILQGATIYGNAIISNSTVLNNARIFGTALIANSTNIGINAYISNNNDYMLKYVNVQQKILRILAYKTIFNGIMYQIDNGIPMNENNFILNIAYRISQDDYRFLSKVFKHFIISAHQNILHEK